MAKREAPLVQAKAAKAAKAAAATGASAPSKGRDAEEIPPPRGPESAMDGMVRVSPHVSGTKVERTLGSGTFSRVVLARDPRGYGSVRSVDIALKIARSDGFMTRQQILWEAACLREVAHANVIRLLDVRASTPGGEEDPCDLPILVFPPADMNLATFLDKMPRGLLPSALACKMMGQLAAALAHIHSHNIIHRDVKPGNCLIFLAAEVHEEFLKPALVLADFGLARRVSGDPRWCLDDAQQAQPMTARVCTAWYRPPELWAVTMDNYDVDEVFEETETAPYGSSLDVWSFGAVVYEALSGQTLAGRAGSGAAMVLAVADVIGACPTQGLEYTRAQRWMKWAAAVELPPSRPLPESRAEWDLVRTCLRWDPAARVTMASAQQCLWFAERVATPDAAPTSQPGTCADASTLSTARVDASTPSAETLQNRALMWLEADLSPPKTTRASSKTRCSCTGHCRIFKHRREGKCDCTELVIGTAYCTRCKCIVMGCDRPRNKSDFCFHHKGVVAQSPLRVQLAVAAVPHASLLVPCDIVDFLSHSALLQDDLAMLILTAAIKEPLPVRALVDAWKQLPAQYTGSDLRSAVCTAVAAADGAPHGAQLAQLHRQGVQRFFGLITTASNLGIIGTRPLKQPPPGKATAAAKAKGAEPQMYRLGANLIEYEVLGPSFCKCDKFLEATRAEHHNLTSPSDAGASTPCALDDLLDYGTRRAGEALRRIGVKSGALPFSVEDASGYCIDFLRRKLVAARYINQHLQECDWSVVSKASLQTMSADAHQNLHHIPEAWRAHDISCFFTGRADWALFASMFPCLWGEVADRLSTKAEAAQALELVKSNKFLQVLQQFRRNHGIAPHPAVAYQLMVADQKQRASTPQRKRKASKTVAK